MKFSVNQYIDTMRMYRHNLWRHAAVFSHTSVRERLALFHVAKNLPADARALEIGSYLGSSALFICAGLSHINGPLNFVDTRNNDAMHDGMRDTYAEFRANTRCYDAMITPVRKMSHDLTEDDVAGPLDFVFIDGDHGEHAVRRDFNLVSKWMRPNSIVAFHDVSEAFPGVAIVIGEAMASGKWQLAGHADFLGLIRRVA
jgi:predicted O-methyltransferase YrrM